MYKQRNGFTLVELIVVITILAILGTIAIMAFSGYSKNARDSVRVTDISNIMKGVELYSLKAGNYPEPDEAVVYTGGTSSSIKQGKIGDLVSSNISISGDLVDPLTQKKYVYSVFGNSKYYQIGAEKENDQSLLIDSVYAENGKVMVKGNYIFDPSLPSLIVVPSSVTGSGIFDPSVCFVVDGGANTLDMCNETKSEMVLKSQDSSLVGYWDMETYYQTSYSGTNDVVFLKDLSGNGFDTSLKFGSTLLNTIETLSGSIFKKSKLGDGVVFDNSNFMYGFSTIPLGNTFSYTGGVVNYVPGDIFFQSSSGSGNFLRPGISASIVFDYDRTQATGWGVKRILSFSLTNRYYVDSGDFLKAIDSSFVRFVGEDLHEHLTPYNDGPSTSTGVYGLNGCGNNNLTIDPPDACASYSHYEISNISGENMLYIKIDFGNKNYCTYLNGILLTCESISQSVIDRLQEGGYKYGGFTISSPSIEPFSGIISDVKIYNRALSDEEILQQAKIAGF